MMDLFEGRVRNLKQVISNSQFHFGYVNIPEE